MLCSGYQILAPHPPPRLNKRTRPTTYVTLGNP